MVRPWFNGPVNFALKYPHRYFPNVSQFRGQLSASSDVASRSHEVIEETTRAAQIVTTRASLVNETSTASAAALLVVVSVPGIDKFFTVFLNHAVNNCQFVAPKAPRLRQLDWFQPEFCILLGVFNVDVCGLRD
jgi:hypothetical protein